jgi:chromosome transmission fidelity protein 18
LVFPLQVLLWLKQWDSCVFGSEIRSTSDEVLSALKRHSSINQHQKLSDSKFPRNNRGSRWNNEKFKHFNGMNHENNDSKRVQELPNKSRSTGQPEQKVKHEILSAYFAFILFFVFLES